MNNKVSNEFHIENTGSQHPKRNNEDKSSDSHVPKVQKKAARG